MKIKFYLKEILILAYILTEIGSYISRIAYFGISLKLVVYLFFLIISLAGLFMASHIKNNFTRISLSLLFFISSVFIILYKEVTSGFLTYNTFITLLNSFGFAGEAFDQFFSLALQPVSKSLLLFFGLILKPQRKSAMPNSISFIFPLAVLILTCILIYVNGDLSTKGLPAPYTPLAYSTLACYEVLTGTEGDRQPIKIERHKKIVDYDIIFIVDESIAPAYLDINSKNGVRTNLVETYEQIDIYNYGYAAAIANCSASSNLSLRYGGTRENYMVASSVMPSIWQYAKNAGLRTVFIDTQTTGKKLQNHMTDDETKDIDEFIQFDNVSVMNRDISAGIKLKEYLNNDTREFVFINKIGGHFPIHDKYPEDYLFYEPALPRGKYKDIIQTGSWFDFSGKSEDWILYRNSYRNTLLWNVGHFFKELFSEGTIGNAVIIYTADHGQNLHENGSEGLYTHCSSDPGISEGIVPLVIIEEASIKTLDWQKHLSENFNRSSHYEIFPTLLLLMHYKPDQVEAFYGNSLQEKTNEEMTFNTNYYARLGVKPKWKKIEISEIVQPLVSDYIIKNKAVNKEALAN